MTRLPDAQFAEHCRKYELRGFLALAELLGNDIAAAKAVRAEGEFIMSPEWIALEAPRSLDFASKVRKIMVEQKLEWNNQNLLAACKRAMEKGPAKP